MADTLRDIERAQFLGRAGWADATRHPLKGDASFRRYFRLERNGQSAMLMDAPPTHEDVRPFVTVDRHLRDLGFSAPRILAEDEGLGFLLLEDFGDATFTNLLASGADEADLYRLGTDVLVALHAIDKSVAAPDWLPPYNDQRLLAEAALLLDWFMPAQGIMVTTRARAEYERIWQGLFAHAHAGPRTLVLRDHHVDNLMRLDGRDGIKGCGLLDFQDALAGHPAYDLMSLLEDARRDIPDALQAEMKARYFDALGVHGPDREAFQRVYAILAAQRHAKIIGIFTRLDRRDRKPVYLHHIPRVWRLFERALAHPALIAMRMWVDTHIPAAKRTTPEAES
ncbi:MAG: phosphotransferase [Alphaproteobacteria bacterium]|nr:phosphotransferase [Alphaproteobacteria bacterium]